MEIVKGDLKYLDEIAEIERECFPPEQAASYQSLKERLTVYPECFWILKEEEKILSFINGMRSDEEDLSDEMYENASLHQNEGQWQMLFGVNTRPAYRKRGYASALIRACINESHHTGRKGVVLTCLKEKIPFYERLGFVNEGISESVHGNAVWYQMRIEF